jgi:hypothetical protein
MTTAPPGTLTGTAPRQDTAAITVPGLYHNWPCVAMASDTEYIRGTKDGPVNDGDLVFACHQATGPMRIHYTTAEQWRAMALAATRIADWLEAGT